MSRWGRSPREVQCTTCRKNTVKVFLAESEEVEKAECDECRQNAELDRIEEEHLQDQELAASVKIRPQGYMQRIVKQRGVPKQYVTCSFDNWQGQHPSVLPAIVIGQTGVGKTHLAVAFMKQWIAKHTDLRDIPTKSAAMEKLADTAKRCIFIPAIDLMWEMRALTNHKGGQSIDEAMREYSAYDFSVVDDLGAERQTEWAVEVLTKLVFARHSEERHTLFTSNLTMAQISETFGDRTASRILDFGMPYQITSTMDWRKKRSLKINEKEVDDSEQFDD